MVKEKSFYKQLALLSLPIAAQNIITYLVSLADNVMVARLGETAVSGVYVANQITSLLQMFCAGVSAAVMVLASQYWGRGGTRGVKYVNAVAFKLCTVVSVCLWLSMLFFGGIILSRFTNDEQVVDAAVRYVRIICFSYFPFCISSILITSMRCVESVKIGTRTALASLIVNLFLNWVLIFGNLGAPALGIEGAAWATLISRVAQLAMMLIYVLKTDKKLKMRPTELLSTDRAITKDFIKYGTPVILGDLVWGLNIMAQGAIVGHLGTAAIAAVSIANTLFSIISVGSYGIRDGAAIMIGKAVGSGDFGRVKAYAKTMQLLFLAMGCVTGAVVFLSRFAVPYIYSEMSAQTIAVAKQFLVVLSVSVVGTSYQMATLTGIVRAGGATHFVLINDLIHVWLIVIPSALLAAFVFGAPAWVVFACLKCDQILKCGIAFIKVNRFKWFKNLTQDEHTQKEEKISSKK